MSGTRPAYLENIYRLILADKSLELLFAETLGRGLEREQLARLDEALGGQGRRIWLGHRIVSAQFQTARRWRLEPATPEPEPRPSTRGPVPAEPDEDEPDEDEDSATV